MAVDDKILQQLIKNSSENAAQVKLLTKLVKDQSALLSKPDSSKLSGNTRQRERRDRQKGVIGSFREGTKNAMSKFPDPRNPQSLSSMYPGGKTLGAAALFGMLFGASPFQGLEKFKKQANEINKGIKNLTDEIKSLSLKKLLFGSNTNPVGTSKAVLEKLGKNTSGAADNRAGLELDEIDKKVAKDSATLALINRTAQQIRDEAGKGRTASKYKPSGKTVGSITRTVRGLTGRRTMTPLADRIAKARDTAARGMTAVKEFAEGGIDPKDYERMSKSIVGRGELKIRSAAREGALKIVNAAQARKIKPSRKDQKLAQEGLELLKEAGLVSKTSTLTTGVAKGSGSATASKLLSDAGKAPGSLKIKSIPIKVGGTEVKMRPKTPKTGLEILEEMTKFRAKDPAYKSTILKEGQDAHKINEAMKKVVKHEYTKKGMAGLAEGATREAVEEGTKRGLLSVLGQSAKVIGKGALRVVGTPLTVAESLYYGYGAKESIAQREAELEPAAKAERQDEYDFLNKRREASKLLREKKISPEFYAKYVKSLQAVRARRRLSPREGMEDYSSAAWNILGGLTGTISDAGAPLTDAERAELEEANKILKESSVKGTRAELEAAKVGPYKNKEAYSTNIYNNFITQPSADPTKIFEDRED